MEQKLALITGGTDGLGKALASSLLKENYEVVIIGRSMEKIEATIKELKSEGANKNIHGFKADLSLMSEVKNAIDDFLSKFKRLDLLVLNANAISNKRIVTDEGNEKNFSLGYLSRVLMIQKLEKILEGTVNSQIISVIGLSISRLNFDDITIEKKFTGWKGLERWQWAMNLFAREYNKTSKVPINLYMPGLVKTKILSNEPQPMRLIVQIANLIMGISSKEAAANMLVVIKKIDAEKIRNVTFSYAKERKPLDLKLETADGEKLLELNKKLLSKYKS